MVRLVIAGLVGVIGAAAAGAEPAPMSSNERAYILTVMCTAIASEYGNDADQQRSLDAARKMARVQGYNDHRLSDDLGSAASVLGIRARNRIDALSRDRDICRRMGLLS